MNNTNKLFLLITLLLGAAMPHLSFCAAQRKDSVPLENEIAGWLVKISTTKKPRSIYKKRQSDQLATPKNISQWINSRKKKVRFEKGDKLETYFPKESNPAYAQAVPGVHLRRTQSRRSLTL